MLFFIDNYLVLLDLKQNGSLQSTSEISACFCFACVCLQSAACPREAADQSEPNQHGGVRSSALWEGPAEGSLWVRAGLKTARLPLTVMFGQRSVSGECLDTRSSLTERHRVGVCSGAAGGDHCSWRQRPGDLSPAHRASARQPRSGRQDQSQAVLTHGRVADVTDSALRTVTTWRGRVCRLRVFLRSGVSSTVSPDWGQILRSPAWSWHPVLCLTGTTADRFYRIDRAQVCAPRILLPAPLV